MTYTISKNVNEILRILNFSHFKIAINYPAPNLGRDKMIPELYKFKNSPGKLIVVYHLDERSGIPHANSMSQKGYENVYLLNGGVEAFLEAFPEAVEGKKVPVPLKQGIMIKFKENFS